MRDYKHVKVPRRERTRSRTRTVSKRFEFGPSRGRKRAGSARQAATLVLSVLLTAALCYGAWSGYRWITRSPLFQIAGVDIKGVRQVSDEEIRGMAALFTGQNIFQVDIGAVARKASAHPWVRDIRIERRLPNRISMVFSERVPRAVLQAANGRYLMDGDGTAIVPVREAEAAGVGLPTIAVRDRRTAPRDRIESEALPVALELLDELALRGGWDLGDVTVTADSPETVAIVYAGREFRVGSGSYDEKLRRLGEIVSDMNRRGLDYAYVDLRPERQAAVMVKNTKGRR
jgi:cell division protein FtsQ